MDRSEDIAEGFLRLKGFKSIRFEPDGNIPPDFLVDDRIAVEVRRLNQNEPGALSPKGLEEVQIPLVMRIQRLLNDHSKTSTRSWWVAVRFSRPVVRWSTLRPSIKAALTDILNGTLSERSEHEVAPRFRMEFLPAPDEKEWAFHLGAFSDHDSGGWVLGELERNLRLCIAEKEAKVARYRHRYPEWWLVLIDQIAYGLSRHDQEEFRKLFSFEHQWDRIYLVGALDPARSFQV